MKQKTNLNTILEAQKKNQKNDNELVITIMIEQTNKKLFHNKLSIIIFNK